VSITGIALPVPLLIVLKAGRSPHTLARGFPVGHRGAERFMSRQYRV